MSLLSIALDVISAASGNLQSLGAELNRANAAAASQTTAIAAPAADEVSAAITSLFGAHAQEFQALNARAAAFHAAFVNLLSGGAAQYVSTEAANVQQALTSLFNAPATGHSAAVPAGAPLPGPSTQTYELGPIGTTVTSTTIPLATPGTSRTDYYGSVNLNTPFGNVPVTSFHGTTVDTVQGAFAQNGYVNTPLGPVGGSMTVDERNGGILEPTHASVTVFGYTFGDPGY
ncbi:PE family protein [Mycobacterium sp. UM_CSW]|uniref:PE family protein n=1 Tax=Mycobacterium sp. UM_CSW TaxID=1370119 RepID=UPI0003FCBA7B|nr:PE family protein [Mycobacterium sp. UM_CSW]